MSGIRSMTWIGVIAVLALASSGSAGERPARQSNVRAEATTTDLTKTKVKGAAARTPNATKEPAPRREIDRGSETIDRSDLLLSQG